MIRKTLLALLLCAVTGLGLAATAKQKEAAVCSDRSLSGSFGVTGKGALVGSGGPIATIARVEFDGAGHFTAKGTTSSDGKVSHDAEVKGSYSLQPDCSGSVNDDGDIASLVFPSGYFVFSPSRGELRLVGSDAATIMDFQGKRQFTSGKSRRCGKGELIGKYVSTGGGQITGQGNVTGVGIIASDGKGGLEIRRSVSFNGKMLSDVLYATYSVNEDCLGEFSYGSEERLAPHGPTTFDSFVIDDDGNELRVIGLDPQRVLTIFAQKQFGN